MYRSYYSFYFDFLEINECLGTIAIVEQVDQIAAVDFDTTLWHMSEKGVKVLHSKKVLPGLKCVNVDYCESCV